MESLKYAATLGLVSLFVYFVSFTEGTSERKLAGKEGENTGGGSRGGAGDERRKEQGSKSSHSHGGNNRYASPIIPSRGAAQPDRSSGAIHV